MAEIRTGNLCHGKLIASLLHQRQMQKKSITSRPSPIFTILSHVYSIFALRIEIETGFVSLINYQALNLYSFLYFLI
jgi:hypothetical protein